MSKRLVLAVLAGCALAGLASCIYVVNLSPIASFTATPALGTTPLDVALDASNSSDPDGAIASYLWNFGDGQTASTSAFPFTHQFTVQSDARTFTVVLTVTDDDGATDTAVQNVTVNPAP